MIAKCLQKGIEFLYRDQLDWGEFPLLRLNQNPRVDPIYSTSVFATTFVLHALSFTSQTSQVKEMREKGAEFVMNHREKPGVWRYFGRFSRLAPDLDTTSCASVALMENDIEVTSILDNHPESLRDTKSRLFKTWIEKPPTCENDTDSVVNANILFYLAKKNLMKEVQEISGFLVRESSHLHVQNSQVWYYSPELFAYAVSRTSTLGKIDELNKAINPLSEYLLFTQQSYGGWASILSTAFAVNALINFGYHGKELDRGIDFILKHQDHSDGYWLEEVFCIPESGSKHLTTSVCVEALAKSLQCN